MLQNLTQDPYKGYLICASYAPNFYLYALNLIESIRDHDPNANICLAVSPYLCDGRESIADHVIHVGDTPREKLIALTKTPFDITMYIDADSEVMHDDISTCFDQLNGNDIMFCALTAEREYCYTARSFPGGALELCGANFVYDNRKQIVKDFMKDWKDYYWAQHYNKDWWPTNEEGQPDYALYPETYRQWDQFTLWWLTKKVDKYKDLKFDIFEDDARWNWYALYIESRTPIKDPAIIHHHSWGVSKYEKSYGNIGQYYGNYERS